jgi:Fur family transcriptional regulator, peroxide stress response regulator
MNYRGSKQRERILELLKKTHSHPTADWLYMTLKGEIPNLSLGTVYRNLKILVEQGLILKLSFGSTFDRFEAKIAPHYHLVCENCGVVDDINMPQFSQINAKAEKLTLFKIVRHQIYFFGICDKCLG